MEQQIIAVEDVCVMVMGMVAAAAAAAGAAAAAVLVVLVRGLDQQAPTSRHAGACAGGGSCLAGTTGIIASGQH